MNNKKINDLFLKLTHILPLGLLLRILKSMLDVAVSYTSKEVFGLNNVEYMLMKKPCISANSGGMPELYGDTNILVEPDNPHALKEALKRYANDPALMAREAAKGCERAVIFFNGERIYNDTMKEYNLAIAKRYKTPVNF